MWSDQENVNCLNRGACEVPDGLGYLSGKGEQMQVSEKEEGDLLQLSGAACIPNQEQSNSWLSLGASLCR